MITQEYLKECLEYNENTGIFTWRHRPRSHFLRERDWRTWNKRFSGKKSGTIDNGGYLMIRINKQSFRAHRLVWLYIFGEFTDKHIDHINCDKKDNRLCNIREANQRQNSQNISCHHINNKVGYLGVHRNGSKYRAMINDKGKTIHVGYFNTAHEAHNAYLKAKRKLHEFCTI